MFPVNNAQRDLIEKARRFAQDHLDFLSPGGERIQRAAAMYRAYAKAGYHALLIPRDLHGQGLDYVSAGLVYETLSYHLPGTLHGPVTTAHCAEMLKVGLKEEVKRDFLTAVADKGLALGFCLTEEGAGSDIASITASAKKTGKGYLISGKKDIVINHAIASHLIVFAVTLPARGHAGMNAFLVDPGLPGVRIGKAYDSCEPGTSVLGDVSFDQTETPAESLLGEEGSAYFLIIETLDKGRPLVAACCCGSAGRALDLVLDHVKSRSQFGRPLFSFQGLSFPLAEHATRLNASRLLTLNALNRIDTNQSFSLEASMAKLHASETLSGIADFGIETLGYRIVARSHEICRIHYDAQLMKSIDGTANVQKMVIASQL